MSAFVLLAVAGAAYLLTRAKTSDGFTHTKEQEDAVFNDMGGGFKAYKPGMQSVLLNGLVAKKVIPKSSLEGAWQTIEQAGAPVGINESAYIAAQGLQANGYDLWISPGTMHLPTKKGKRFKLLWTEPGTVPADQYKGKAALLIQAVEPWPDPPVQGAEPPPPPAPPAPPAGATPYGS